MVYVDRSGDRITDIGPLRAFLELVVGPFDLISLNAPDLPAHLLKAVEAACLATSAVSYHGSFLNGDLRQALILEADGVSLLLQELDTLDTSDSFCIYRFDEATEDKRTELLRILELMPPGNPEWPGFQPIWIAKALPVCSSILAPGADGAILEIWSNPAWDAPLLDRGIEAANRVLQSIAAEHGELPYNEMLNTYAQPRMRD